MRIIPHISITQTKHTDLSCHTGSCMAHLNYFPTRVAGVNFCFLTAVHLVVSVGIMITCNGVMQNRRQNGYVKLWVLCYMVK